MNICNCHGVLPLCTSYIMQDKEHEVENMESLYTDRLLHELGQNIYNCWALISAKQGVYIR